MSWREHQGLLARPPARQRCEPWRTGARWLSTIAVVARVAAGAAGAEPEVQFSKGCAVPDAARMATQGPYLAVTQPPANVVLVFDVSGTVPRLLWTLEGAGESAGQFNRPGGIAIDAGRRLLFVSDTNNHRVQVFQFAATPSAGPPRFAKAIGRKGRALGELDRPGGLALDGAGNLYVIDAGNSRVQVFDADLHVVRAFGEAGDDEGQFRLPLSVTTAPDGALVYVVDGEQGRIHAFDRGGHFRFRVGERRAAAVPVGTPGHFLYPFGIAAAPDASLYVTDCGDHVIHRFDARGQRLGSWGTFGVADGQLNQPKQIAIDADARVIVLDFSARRGQLFSPAGAFLGTFRLTRSALGMPTMPSAPTP